MKYILSIFLFVAVFLLLSSPLHAKQKKDPDLKDIIITTSDSHLLLFATVQNCFTKEMATAQILNKESYPNFFNVIEACS
ncbi:MAG TPA: hypothetical protein ENK96_02375 [Desulfobulbaceae bacterium]|nr:hypothetical protein [Desulfobulbaceae bacterium]